MGFLEMAPNYAKKQQRRGQRLGVPASALLVTCQNCRTKFENPGRASRDGRILCFLVDPAYSGLSE